MCYTSGTTGNPKGVVYSHRSTYLHSMSVCMANSDRHRRRRSRPAGRVDVPCECLGPAVCRRDGRRRSAAARPLPAGRTAGRHDRAATPDDRRRRPDDLERRTAVSARQSRPGHLVAEDGVLRRFGRAAGHDEGVRGALRRGHPSRLGHDRDLTAGRARHPTAGGDRRGRLDTARLGGPGAVRSRDPHRRRRGQRCYPTTEKPWGR